LQRWIKTEGFGSKRNVPVFEFGNSAVNFSKTQIMEIWR
jgi:hypothetical protein